MVSVQGTFLCHATHHRTSEWCCWHFRFFWRWWKSLQCFCTLPWQWCWRGRGNRRLSCWVEVVMQDVNAIVAGLLSCLLDYHGNLIIIKNNTALELQRSWNPNRDLEVAEELGFTRRPLVRLNHPILICAQLQVDSPYNRFYSCSRWL